jgi:hypothetical protein
MGRLRSLDSGRRQSRGQISSLRSELASEQAVNHQLSGAEDSGLDAETNVQEAEARRQVDVYVFALLAHTDQPTIDPLDMSQWQFFILPTSVLDSRTRSQHSIPLRTLISLSGGAVTYGALREAVLTAAAETRASI